MSIVEKLTIFLSSLALSATIWHSYKVRKHFKLTVRPLLNIDYSTFSTLDKRGIYIENNGVGPAIIKNFLVYLDDELIINNKDGSWWEITSKLDIDTEFINVFKYRLNDSIASNHRQYLYFFEGASKDSPSYYGFYNSLKKIKVEVEYESIYKEKQTKSVFEYSYT